MATYKIVGPLNVAGKAPGSVLSDDELEGCDIDHLIGAGHIALESKADKAATIKNKED